MMPKEERDRLPGWYNSANWERLKDTCDELEAALTAEREARGHVLAANEKLRAEIAALKVADNNDGTVMFAAATFALGILLGYLACLMR